MSAFLWTFMMLFLTLTLKRNSDVLIGLFFVFHPHDSLAHCLKTRTPSLSVYNIKVNWTEPNEARSSSQVQFSDWKALFHGYAITQNAVFWTLEWLVLYDCLPRQILMDTEEKSRRNSNRFRARCRDRLRVALCSRRCKSTKPQLRLVPCTRKARGKARSFWMVPNRICKPML